MLREENEVRHMINIVRLTPELYPIAHRSDAALDATAW